MSNSAKTRTRANQEPTVTEQDVVEFLQSNPDIFERNPRLLTALELPHGVGGTVSLVERQVSALRQQDLATKRKLNELVGLARRNDALASRIHALALALIESSTLEETLTIIEEKLRRSFSADAAVMVLFGYEEDYGELIHQRFLKVHQRDATCLAPFGTFLERSDPRCGQVRDSQRSFLFGRDADEIGSMALVPLGANSTLGFLAIGSHNADHFNPGMSVDFLKRIGQLISVALDRY
ncbi:MAG: DUF484 family protein [Pseudomonadota bacterium]